LVDASAVRPEQASKDLDEISLAVSKDLLRAAQYGFDGPDSGAIPSKHRGAMDVE
jgi:hypothetical protein